MTNHSTYAAMNALTERLARLETRVAELEVRLERDENATYDFCAALKRDLQGLATRVAALETDGPRAVEGVLECVKAVSENVQTFGRDQTDMLERLQNIELKFFPHLRKDMSHLYDIIGDSADTADNPLDRRTP